MKMKGAKATGLKGGMIKSPMNAPKKGLRGK